VRAKKICSNPYCSNIQPCPDHERKPWEGSKRSERTNLSGSRQQKRAKYVLEKHDTICHVCGHPGSNQADHVIPLAEGGADTTTNMRPIHDVPCHRDKTAAEAARARSMNFSA
jgi:5-methylcytosine-specific restriction protein A